MKHLLLILFTTFNLSLFAQTEKPVGTYEKVFNANNGDVMTWTITLNPDGTFLYRFYRNFQNGIPPEENFYSKGRWRFQKHLVFFSTTENDLDDTHTMNFTNTRARINSKSPRDKSDRIIKTSIVFYDSEISEVKGLELFKETN